MLLRLAKAMNHGNPGNVTRVTAKVDGKKVSLKLVSKRNRELEVWMLQKERPYFREVFGRDLVVARE